MIKLNNRFAIGCLIQWYEIEQIELYLESVKQSLESIRGEIRKIDLPDFVNNYPNKNGVSKFEIKDYWIDVWTPDSLKKAINEWSDNDL